MTIESKLPAVLNQATGSPTLGKSSALSAVDPKTEHGFSGLVSAMKAQDAQDAQEAAVDNAPSNQPMLVGKKISPSAIIDPNKRKGVDSIAHLISSRLIQSASIQEQTTISADGAFQLSEKKEKNTALDLNNQALADTNSIANFKFGMFEEASSATAQLPLDPELDVVALMPALPTAVDTASLAPALATAQLPLDPELDVAALMPALPTAVDTASLAPALTQAVLVPQLPPRNLNLSVKSTPLMPITDKPLAKDVVSPQKTVVAPANTVLPLLAPQSEAAHTNKASSFVLQDAKLGQSVPNFALTPAAAVLPMSAAVVTDPGNFRDFFKPINEREKPQGRAYTGVYNDIPSAPSLFDKWGINPSYAVVQASAVVPNTQVAETVSYWVTHGVQNAELILDGLGSEPVQVQISVDGDQARIDFRTSQIEVRQALEGAASQLKSLLASEGLQLQGMSVGTSARGDTSGDNHQSKFASLRRATVSSVAGVESLVSASSKIVNAHGGRTLDLYV